MFRNTAFAACCLFTWLGMCPGFLLGNDPVQAPAIEKQPDAAAPRCIPFRVREQDEVWAVSTRGSGCLPGGTPTVGFHVLKYAEQRWNNSTAADFYATDDAEVGTVLYVHGNRIDYQGSLRDGLDTYFQLIGRLDDERPVRFVIWSWPSDQIKGPLNDIRAKAARTNDEGYLLATFVAGISSDVPTGLVGYSFGARVVTGGLHLLGGGTLCGRGIAAGERPPLRVALWAAAVHNDWLLPGRTHGRALPLADAWYITINGCDPVLQRYHFIEKCGDPVALGQAGMWGMNQLPTELRERIEQENVSHLVGGSHDRRLYLYSPSIAERTRQYVLWHDLPGRSMKEQQAPEVAQANVQAQ